MIFPESRNMDLTVFSENFNTILLNASNFVQWLNYGDRMVLSGQIIKQ